MRYRGELRLDFHPTTLQAQGLHQDRPITLSYAPDATRGPTTRNSDPTPELALILHALRTRISHLSQTSISPKTLLCSISRSWDTVCSIRDEIRALDYCGVTKAKTIEVNPHEPALLKVRCILLGTRVELKRHRKSLSRPVGPLSAEIASGQTKARLDIDFTIKPRPVVAESGRDDELNIVDIDVDVDVSAAKVYGFSEDDGASSGMSEGQIGDFLTRLIHRQDGKDKQLGKGLWKDAVKELENKAFS